MAASSEARAPKPEPRVSVTERDSEGARRQQQIEVHRHRLRPADDFVERPRDDVRRIPRDHRAEAALLDQLDGLAAEARREDAIEARRRAAALQVAEDDAARLLLRLLGNRRAELRADAAEPLDVLGIGRFLQRDAAALRERAFRDDADAELRAPLVPRAETLGDDLDVEGDLGDENG